MKRLLVAVTALLASLAIGLATVSATAGAAGDSVATQSAKKKKKKKKKIRSFISLTVTVTDPTPGTPGTPPTPPTTYNPGSPGTPGTPGTPGSGSYSGRVTSKNARCVVGRAVSILRGGVAIEGATTPAGGAYRFDVPSRPPAGTYTAFARKKVFTKKTKKINPKTGKRIKRKVVCRAAFSPPVIIP